MFTKDTEMSFNLLIGDARRISPKDNALILQGKSLFARAKNDSVVAERARKRAEASYAALRDFLKEARVKVDAVKMCAARSVFAKQNEERENAANKLVAREIAMKQILALLNSAGPLTSPQIAKVLDLTERTVSRYMKILQSRGKVNHTHRFAPWTTRQTRFKRIRIN